MNNTPLRYPGGKSIMTSFFADLVIANGMDKISYAEPYAGGAGTAINLLLNRVAENILINDANICIYSFWKYAIQESERFIGLIEETPIDLNNWKYCHDYVKSAQKPSFELGFATFYLSRTNRSGILTAGPIGGMTPEKQENASYKIDCRFNKKELIDRIRRIAEFRDNIVVSNLDAIDFLKTLPNCGNTLVYLDPPYFTKGKSLYLNYYNENDHRILSNYLSGDVDFKWVLSYDNVDEIRRFYEGFDLYEFELSYTAQCAKKGFELLTHSKDLVMPADLLIKKRKKNIKLNKID